MFLVSAKSNEENEIKHKKKNEKEEEEETSEPDWEGFIANDVNCY